MIESSAIGSLHFMVKKLPEKVSIIKPWLKQGEIGLISAARGVGKTWLSLFIAMAATRDMKIGKWETETPTGCLYIDGEMAAYDMQQRLLELHKVCNRNKAPFNLLSVDHLRSSGGSAPNFVNINCRKGVLDYLKKNQDIRLLIIDNLACLTPGIDENSKKEWDQINQWLLELRAIGTAVIMIHHTGKSGKQRGTSAREDLLDFSIDLKNPQGYSPEDGAKFIIEFTKGRRLYGDNIKPFIFNLQKEGMKLTWKTGEVKDGVKKGDIIINMLNEGIKQKDIAEKLGVSESYVSQIKKEASKKGKLNKADLRKEIKEEITESEEEHKDIKI